MNEKKPNRNALRSRELIRGAFLELLEEKDISDITVTEIIRRTGLNRTTFYAHYPDVRGVLEEFETETTEKMLKLLSEFEVKSFFQNPVPLLIQINRYLEENPKFYRTLALSSAEETLLGRLENICASHMYNDPSIPEALRSSAMFQMRVCFFGEGIAGIYRRWLKGELSGSLNDIVHEVGRVIADSSREMLKER